VIRLPTAPVTVAGDAYTTASERGVAAADVPSSDAARRLRSATFTTPSRLTSPGLKSGDGPRCPYSPSSASRSASSTTPLWSMSTRVATIGFGCASMVEIQPATGVAAVLVAACHAPRPRKPETTPSSRGAPSRQPTHAPPLSPELIRPARFVPE